MLGPVGEPLKRVSLSYNKQGVHYWWVCCRSEGLAATFLGSEWKKKQPHPPFTPTLAQKWVYSNLLKVWFFFLTVLYEAGGGFGGETNVSVGFVHPNPQGHWDYMLTVMSN